MHIKNIKKKFGFRLNCVHVSMSINFNFNLTFAILIFLMGLEKSEELDMLSSIFDMESFKNYDLEVYFHSGLAPDPALFTTNSVLSTSLAAMKMLAYQNVVGLNWMLCGRNCLLTAHISTHLVITFTNFHRKVPTKFDIIMNDVISNINFVIIPDANISSENWRKQFSNKTSRWKNDIYIVQFCETIETENTKGNHIVYNAIRLLESSRPEILKTNANSLGDKIQIEDVIKFRKGDFVGSSIKAAAVLEEPYIIHTGQKESLRFTGGFDFEIFDYIADSYNLTTIPVDGIEYASTSVHHLNHSRPPDIGTKIVNGEADVSLSPHEYHGRRLAQFSYLHPIYVDKFWGYFVQPPASNIFDIFIQPFQIYLWLTILSSWLLTIVVTFVLLKFKEQLKHSTENDMMIWNDGFLWVLSIVCQQGCSVQPESAPLRCVLLTCLLTNLITYLAYSAALVSILSVVIVPINVMSDLKAGKFEFYGNINWPTSKDILEEIGENKSGVLYVGTDVGIRVILNSNAVFVAIDDEFYSSLQRNFSHQYICSTISKISPSRIPLKTSMIVKKYSPIREYFNLRISWMYNNGIWQRLRRAHTREFSVSCLKRTRANVNENLGIQDLFTAFAMLATLSASSLLIFVIENLFPPKLSYFHNHMP